METLLKAGANVNTRNKRGKSPLHAAAARLREAPAVLDALLKAGADAGARDRSGRTPFDFAKKNSKLKGTAPYWRLNDARFKQGGESRAFPHPGRNPSEAFQAQRERADCPIRAMLRISRNDRAAPFLIACLLVHYMKYLRSFMSGYRWATHFA